MTIHQALAGARERLRAAGIEDADLEAEILLRHTLGLDRAGLYQRLQEPLDDQAGVSYEALIERRLSREPSAYITGHREFYGLDFLVTPATLIPRPETETLVEAALELAHGLSEPLIADVGTGSGAIAVSLAHELPGARIYAIDASPEALDLARQNAQRHGVEGRIDFLQGDLLAPLPQAVDLIVANLPYVTVEDWQTLQPEVRDFEPRLALDGGADGLNLIRQLLAQAPSQLKPGGAVLLEFGADQADAITQAALACSPGASIACRTDFAGRARVLIVGEAVC